MVSFNIRGSLVASVLATVGASVCCVVPLVLLGLGIGGAWVSKLTALEPVRPFFIAVTLAFLGLAFRSLYVLPRACAPGTSSCPNPRTLKRQRLIFWLVAASVTAVLAIPLAAPLFY